VDEIFEEGLDVTATEEGWKYTQGSFLYRDFECFGIPIHDWKFCSKICIFSFSKFVRVAGRMFIYPNQDGKPTRKKFTADFKMDVGLFEFLRLNFARVMEATRNLKGTEVSWIPFWSRTCNSFLTEVAYFGEFFTCNGC
jgi:hypothetical protein